MEALSLCIIELLDSSLCGVWTLDVLIPVMQRGILPPLLQSCQVSNDNYVEFWKLKERKAADSAQILTFWEISEEKWKV
jgi:hypothetical protein